MADGHRADGLKGVLFPLMARAFGLDQRRAGFHDEGGELLDDRDDPLHRVEDRRAHRFEGDPMRSLPAQVLE